MEEHYNSIDQLTYCILQLIHQCLLVLLLQCNVCSVFYQKAGGALTSLYRLVCVGVCVCARVLACLLVQTP